MNVIQNDVSLADCSEMIEKVPASLSIKKARSEQM